MTHIDIITGVLAAWRISHMLLRENGPWRIFRHMRQSLGVMYYDRESSDVASSKYEITVCIWCLSMWVSGAVVLLFLIDSWWARVLTTPYAFSALVVMLDHKFGLK